MNKDKNNNEPRTLINSGYEIEIKTDSQTTIMKMSNEKLMFEVVEGIKEKEKDLQVFLLYIGNLKKEVDERNKAIKRLEKIARSEKRNINKICKLKQEYLLSTMGIATNQAKQTQNIGAKND